MTAAAPPPWRVLVPRRPDHRLAEAIATAGGWADEVDLIHRYPAASPDLASTHAAAAAGQFDWLAVTSAYTINALADLGYPITAWLPSTPAANAPSPGHSQPLGSQTPLGHSRPPASQTPATKLAAVGTATAVRLVEAGLQVDLVPTQTAGGQALADLWPPGPGRVIIPGACTPTQTLATELRRRGWDVTAVGVYRTEPATALAPDITTRWRTGAYAAFIATSGSTATAAATLLGPTIPVVAIGQPSATAARQAGFDRIVVAASPAPADVVAALLNWVA